MGRNSSKPCKRSSKIAFHRPSLRGVAAFCSICTSIAPPVLRVCRKRPSLNSRRISRALVARAYAQIHSVGKRSRFRPFHWLTQTLPVVFRRQWRAFLFATVLLILGSATGVALLQLDPDAKAVLMPFPHLLNDPNERVKQEEKDRGKHITGHQIAFSASLMTHNMSVAFVSMAAGMTFGIGTVLMLFSNGVDLGAVCADYIHAGQTKFLLGWLLPHGLIEIPALLVASQAGLLLASALIGWRTRVPRPATFACDRGRRV